MYRVTFQVPCCNLETQTEEVTEQELITGDTNLIKRITREMDVKGISYGISKYKKPIVITKSEVNSQMGNFEPSWVRRLPGDMWGTAGDES